MMYRYARYKGYSLEGAADFSSYPDAAYVNEFAEEAMAWAVGNGIITGKENPVRLDPFRAWQQEPSAPPSSCALWKPLKNKHVENHAEKYREKPCG